MSVQAMAFMLDYCRTTAAEARGDAPLSPPERAVLQCIANYADQRGANAYPSHPTIADVTGVGLTTVRESCKRMWSLGLLDAERRPGRERGRRGQYVSYRVVMDPDAILRKATARRGVSAYEDDGCDAEGHPRTPAEAPEEDEARADQAEGQEPPDSAVDNTAANLDGGTGNAPAGDANADGDRTGFASDSHQIPTAYPSPAGAPIGNREPSPDEPLSVDRSPDSRARAADEPVSGAVDETDRARAHEACLVLAEQALAKRQLRTDDPIFHPTRFRDAVLRDLLDANGETLAALAHERPDLDARQLIYAHSMGHGDAAVEIHRTRAQESVVLDRTDGSIVLPGTGLLAQPDWPDPVPDGDRARGLEIARGIPRISRPLAGDDPSPGTPGPDPTEA